MSRSYNTAALDGYGKLWDIVKQNPWRRLPKLEEAKQIQITITDIPKRKKTRVKGGRIENGFTTLRKSDGFKTLQNAIKKKLSGGGRSRGKTLPKVQQPTLTSDIALLGGKLSALSKLTVEPKRKNKIICDDYEKHIF